MKSQRPARVMERALNVWVPAVLHDAVRQLSAEVHISISDVTRLALAEYVRRHGGTIEGVRARRS